MTLSEVVGEGGSLCVGGMGRFPASMVEARMNAATQPDADHSAAGSPTIAKTSPVPVLDCN